MDANAFLTELIAAYNAHDKQRLQDLYHPHFEWGTEGDKLFFFWKAKGHQRGRLMNIPPTGKFCSFLGSSFLTLKDGKILRSRRIWDVATALRNIGLLPEPTSSEYA